jgi:hypothetical protein
MWPRGPAFTLGTVVAFWERFHRRAFHSGRILANDWHTEIRIPRLVPNAKNHNMTAEPGEIALPAAAMLTKHSGTILPPRRNI